MFENSFSDIHSSILYFPHAIYASTEQTSLCVPAFDEAPHSLLCDEPSTRGLY